MDAETKQTEVMECPLSYLLSDENGREVEKGEAKAGLAKKIFPFCQNLRGHCFSRLWIFLKFLIVITKSTLLLAQKKNLHSLTLATAMKIF